MRCAPIGSPVDGDELRVRHFVDGRSVTDRPTRVHLLDAQATDLGRRAVPLASADEVERYLEACSEGLARWLALGRGRRTRLIASVHEGLAAETMLVAEAIADDFGVSCETAVALVQQSLDGLAEVLATEQGDPELPLGLHVLSMGPTITGTHFVQFVWPLLLDGSIVVVRPDLVRPRSIAALAEAASRCGLPDGVLNVVHGDDETVRALAANPLVAGLAGIGAAAENAEICATASQFGKLGASVNIPAPR